MSNPFSLFRKNQKAWIAGLTVATMIGFGVLPVVMQMMGSGQPVEDTNPVVFSTNAGEVRQRELQQLRFQRAIINRFYQVAAPENSRQQVPSLPADVRSIADSYILAKKAEQLGIVVSEHAVNVRIHKITGEQLNKKQKQELISEIMFDGRSVKDYQLIQALQHEMMAERAYQLLFAMPIEQTTFGDTPAKMWEYFRQLNRRAKIEAIPIKVDDYIDQVAEPTEAELTAFYEKYNDRFSPENFYYYNQLENRTNVEGVLLKPPVPGFYQPPKAKFQYIVADYDAIRDSITDEDIAKYYEKNKDKQFVQPIISDPEPKKTTSDDEHAPPAPTDEDIRRANEKTEEGETPDETSEPLNKEESKKPSETDTQEPQEPTKEEQPATEVPSSEAPTPTKQSQQTRSTSSQPTGTDDDAEDKPAADAPEGEPTEEAEEKPSEETPAIEKPADVKPGADKPADDKTGEKKDEAKDDKKPQPPKQYMPLDTVRDEIRTKIAKQRVAELEDKGFKAIEAKMSTFTLRYKRDKAAGKKVDEELNPLTDAMVKELGLTLHETPLISARELSEMAGFGKSEVTTIFNFNGQQFPVPQPITEVSFNLSGRSQPMPLFEAKRSQGERPLQLNYLFWKSAEEDAHKPELADIRDEVVRAWKSGRGADEGEGDVRALELANKEALAMADHARQAGRTLTELYGSPKAVEKKDEAGEEKEKKDSEKPVDEKETPAEGSPVSKQPETSVEGEPEKLDAEKKESAPDDKDAVATETPAEKSDDEDAKFTVLDPWPFTWMSLDGPFHLNTQIPELDQIGPDFMKTVFAMKAGEVAVAVNYPKTIVYVVRLDSMDPSEQKLQEQFTATLPEKLNGVARFAINERQQAFVQALQKEFDLKWSLSDRELANQ